ncbi:MAG: GNAT family N-acetyltransferase [Clostridia bacterium]|nr:GNAT family N-acetyltransferase [Clostridia bacterium]
MSKEKLRKLLGIIGTIIGIVGFALCVISIFVAEDIQNVIVKVAIALIIFDVVVIGICTRIFQTKYAVNTAKRIYQDLKRESSPTGKDADNFIDPVSCGLKGEQSNCDNNYLGVPYTYKTPNKHLERLKVFNLILLILFLIIIVIALPLFIFKQYIAGAIMSGCGIAVIILLCIINSIAEKKSSSRTIEIDDENLNKLASMLAKRDVTVQLVEANASDAQVIWEMQKTAFAELLKKYGDYETSPANESLSRVTSRFEDPSTYHYFIKAEEQTVGVIRVVDSKSQEKKRLAQIFIMPEYRLKGYARSAIKAVENIHGSTGWVVETILQERHLLSLYMRLGYRVLNKTTRITSNMFLVVLEK